MHMNVWPILCGVLLLTAVSLRAAAGAEPVADFHVAPDGVADYLLFLDGKAGVQVAGCQFFKSFSLWILVHDVSIPDRRSSTQVRSRCLRRNNTNRTALADLFSISPMRCRGSP